MSIQTQIENQPTISFPKLMINSGKDRVILVTAPGTGTILFDTQPERVGEVITNGFDTSTYRDYVGSLVLGNQ